MLKFEWNATHRTGFLGLWHSARICTEDCHNPFSNDLQSVAFCAQFARGMAHIECFRSQIDIGLPQTAQTFYTYSIAFRFQMYCGMPQSALHFCVRNVAFEFNPAPHHFTSKVSLSEASYLFDAQFAGCKIHTLRIVWAYTKQYTKWSHLIQVSRGT
jgi:hypothetical protein